MSMDEDRDGFAAEYVLGTLDADERAQADALVLVDQDFAAKVRQWERRLGELNVLVAPVEPGAPVWERIKAALASTGQSEHLHLPEVPASPMRHDGDAPGAEIVHDGRPVGRVTSAVPGLALGYVRTEVPDDAELEIAGASARLH
jgi:hypothetical protein